VRKSRRQARVSESCRNNINPSETQDEQAGLVLGEFDETWIFGTERLDVIK